MQSVTHDIRLLSDALTSVEQDAKGLRWAKDRPWKCASHIWEERDLPVIDLHDLSAGLTKKLLKNVEPIATELASGGVVFVTGVGRHSVGLPVLRRVVSGFLIRLERERGWRQRDVGGGRLLLVVDEHQIPEFWRSQTPSMAIWFFSFFVVALVWALQGPALLAVLAVVGFFVVRAIRRSAD